MNRKKEKCAGFEIGSRDIHIAVYENGAVTKVISEALPEGMVREGRILSFEALSDLLRVLRRNYRIRAKNAALVLPSSACYCRRFNTAVMTEGQLRFNLPYEFHEYIPGAREDYFYDYALVSGKEVPAEADAAPVADGVPVADGASALPVEAADSAADGGSLDLMAAAAPKQLIADYISAFKRGGFKLKTAIPDELAMINLARAGGDTAHSHCILDLGHSAVRLYMFDGDKFESLRTLDYGLSALDEIIAEVYNVDIHIAAAYRESDYDGCLSLPRCRAFYNSIAVEVMKAVNFQRFSSGGKEPLHVHCCGGGIFNPELFEVMRETLNLPLLGMNEFLPDMSEDLAEDASVAASAVGAAIQ